MIDGELYAGFMFVYEDGSLNNSEPMDIKTLQRCDPGRGNNDELQLFVRCHNCSELMEFEIGETDNLDGRWICARCKVSVPEKEAYIKLEAENQQYVDEHEIE